MRMNSFSSARPRVVSGITKRIVAVNGASVADVEGAIMRISNRDLVHVWTMANNAMLRRTVNVDFAAREAAKSVELFKAWAATQPDIDADRGPMSIGDRTT